MTTGTLVLDSHPLRLPYGHTRPAHPAIRRARRSVGVRRVIRMAGGAVSLPGCYRGRRRGSPIVLLMGHQGHVPRVHATTDLAEMVDLKPIGNRTALQLPRHPMHVGLSGGSTTHAYDAVPVAIVGAHPQPTIVRAAPLYSPPQPIGQWFRRRTPVLALRAQSPPIDSPWAIPRVGVPVPACRYRFRPSAFTPHGSTP